MSRDLTDFEKDVFVVASSWLCLLGCLILRANAASTMWFPSQHLGWKFSLLLSKERKSLRRRHKSMIITLCHVEFIALATSSWVWGLYWSLLSVAEFPGSLCFPEVHHVPNRPECPCKILIMAVIVISYQETYVEKMSNMPSIVTTWTI